MELSEVGRSQSKTDLVGEPQTKMNDRIVVGGVVVVAIVAVVAIILAAVAVSRPGLGQSNTGSQGNSGQQLPAIVNCYGQGGGSAGGSSANRVYTIALGHNWGAYEYIDKNGYLSGFSKDLIMEVCEAAGMDCRTVWEPYVNCFDSQAGQHPNGGKGLMGRWYDACNGWYVTVNRQAIFKFSSSYLQPYKSQFVILPGKPNVDQTNFEKYTIGFLDGWAYDEKCLFRLYNKTLPSAKIKHASGYTQLYNWLKDGTVDAGYVGIGDLKEYVDKGDLKRVGNTGSCMVRGSAMMSRKDSDFTARWNEGFNKVVSSGRFKKLCDAGKDNHSHKGNIVCV